MFLLPDDKATSLTACAKAHGQKELLVCLKNIFIQLFNFGLLFQDSELGPINRPGDHRYSANVREQPPNGLGQSGVLPLQQELKLFLHEPRRHYFFHLHLLVADCWNKICRLLYYFIQNNIQSRLKCIQSLTPQNTQNRARYNTERNQSDLQSCLESFKSFRAKSFRVFYPLYLNCHEQLKGKRLFTFSQKI